MDAELGTSILAGSKGWHMVFQKEMMPKLMSVLALQQDLVILSQNVNVSAQD